MKKHTHNTERQKDRKRKKERGDVMRGGEFVEANLCD
jgi:hypothetical protein